MLAPPAITYPLSLIPDGPRCSTTGADRPACAAVAALAASHRGDKLMGAARGLDPVALNDCLRRAVTHHGIDYDRAVQWADGINGHTLRAVGFPAVAPINGLTPSAYQVDAVRQMTVAGGVLNLGVGLGKTLTTAYAAHVYRHAALAAGTRCWIVAPLIAHGAWKAYLPFLKAMYRDVQVLSIDSVHKLVGAAPAGGLLIVDEAHYAGVMAARRTKAMHTLRLGFDVCLCLTGTLLHGGVEKALGVLDLAIPGSAGFSSRWKAGEYFNVLVRKRIGQRTVTELAKPTGRKREKFLQFISKYTVALTKESPQVRAEVQIPGQNLHTIEIGDVHASLDKLVADTAVRMFEETGEMPHAQAVAHALLR